MPRVSVIIPTYNRADLLGDAIASVMAQSYQDFEVIVADDGSTDQTAEVMADAIARFGSRIRHLALPHRGQPAAPRNSALAVASGEYISFLDSDDLYLPHKLALQVPALDNNPAVGIVYSNAHFFSAQPDQPTGYVQDGLPTPSGDVFADLLRGNFLTPGVVLIQRKCLEISGGFNEDPALLVSEDYELWLRLAMQTTMLYVPGDVAAIRRHTQNISGDTLRLRSRCLYMLNTLDKRYPDTMTAHKTARHEAYARQHGAVALAAWQQRKIGLAFQHGIHAARHTVQLPGAGLQPFIEWVARRRLRSGVNQRAS
jgi:glycosyltransferase involved in cell wall biosynthesis